MKGVLLFSRPKTLSKCWSLLELSLALCDGDSRKCS
ncbi:hypothetical protein CIPAW_04G150600 [Carya illinoinensis]|uniref:Uncharacterized protein n=1 Tax=Carya illinoinensis TaxID=32201 RepID=A0A8T1QWI0_CARIL|nr:hypothetical protein CIPAW_04G150600 [Carya illinoinensis]